MFIVLWINNKYKLYVVVFIFTNSVQVESEAINLFCSVEREKAFNGQLCSENF